MSSVFKSPLNIFSRDLLSNSQEKSLYQGLFLTKIQSYAQSYYASLRMRLVTEIAADKNHDRGWLRELVPKFYLRDLPLPYYSISYPNRRMWMKANQIVNIS